MRVAQLRVLGGAMARVPDSKLDRLASCYDVSSATGAVELYDGVDDSQWRHPPAFPDAEGA